MTRLTFLLESEIFCEVTALMVPPETEHLTIINETRTQILDWSMRGSTSAILRINYYSRGTKPKDKEFVGICCCIFYV